ncbi:ATP-binding protein [Bacillus sp. FJAT-45350]|uniref:ATP-binding protein n=1 Tax=Bacillus sp. FJAT-45350 TaxID=2011014 RepID=UPI000BB9AB8D|nr:ATP-binding protein [Bacillus sp. FJAT-45350]
MHNYIEPLLLNMLFLVVFLLFVPHIVDTNFKHTSENKKNIIKLFSSAFAVISCISFPFYVNDEIIMDLRWIPIIISGLYIGRKASVILVGVALTYRLLTSGADIGFYNATLVAFIILVAIIFSYGFFNKATKKGRFLIGIGLSLFIALILLVVLVYIAIEFISPYFLLSYTLIFLISTICIIYFLELMRETVYFNKRIIRAEKFEVVSQLASSISHEVRNPLTVVKGFLQMLNNNELPENKKKMYIELSLQEIERANDIIGNYLSFSKPTPEENVILDIKRELVHSIDLITPLLNMNSVTIETDIQPFYIKGDPKTFQQCLLNITKNCIEAMPDGGTLSIRTEEVFDKVMIEIADTGIGMTSVQLARLGEPYYTTKGREGTGLGMMAAIQIIEIMSGKFEVASKLHEGTQIRMFFQKI